MSGDMTFNKAISKFDAFNEDGKVFTINYTEQLPALGEMFLAIKVPNINMAVELQITIRNTGECLFSTVGGEPNISSFGSAPDGLKLTHFIRNGLFKGRLPKASCFSSPEFTGGDRRGIQVIPGGTGGTRIGGSAADGINSIIGPDGLLILSVKSNVNQISYFTLIVDTIEREL